MRTLLALTALMLLLAGAVWWKTRPEENIEKLPPTTASDSRVGVATVGMEPGTTIPTDASFPPRPNAGPRPNSDAGGDHEGDDTKTDLAAAPPKEDPITPPKPPVVDPGPDPAPPAVPQLVTHTIATGDTLYSLVKRYYGTAPESLVDAVAAANKLSDPGSLSPGQKIVMPVIDGFNAPKKP